MVVKTAIKFLNDATDPQLIVEVESGLSGMANNPRFPTPTPTLALVTTGLGSFRTALAEAAGGGKELTAIKNARREELVSLMRQLASYVTTASNGDLAVLLSSGFRIQKPTRSPVGTLPAPDAPVTRQGLRTGELNATTAPVPGAYTYNWQLALASAPDVPVQTVQTTGARYLFVGLTPGQTYNVVLNAVGSAGPSDWSDTGTLMVI